MTQNVTLELPFSVEQASSPKNACVGGYDLSSYVVHVIITRTLFTLGVHSGTISHQKL